jgi:hypothetical protein
MNATISSSTYTQGEPLKRNESSKKQTAAPKQKKKMVPRKKTAAPTKKKDVVARAVSIAAVSAPTSVPDITTASTATGDSTGLVFGCAATERYVFDEVNDHCYFMMLHKAFNSPEG